MKTPKSSILKIQLTSEEKKLFEKASQLAGYQALSDFIFAAMEEKAQRITENGGLILSSESDQQIFFNAILNPREPNEALKMAASEYKDLLTRS